MLVEDDESERKPTSKAICSGGRFHEFDGNHRILCNGKLIIGPHWTTFILSHIFILAPTILFCIFG